MAAREPDPNLGFLTKRDTEVKLPRPTWVKNKTPVPIQITAEQILREARERQEPDIRPPKQKITDYLRSLSVSASSEKPMVVVGFAKADIYVEIDHLPKERERPSPPLRSNARQRSGHMLAGGKGAIQACRSSQPAVAVVVVVISLSPPAKLFKRKPPAPIQFNAQPHRFC